MATQVAGGFKSRYKLLDRPKADDFRQIGFGMSPDPVKIKRAEDGRAGIGTLIDWVKDSVNCPIFNMPVIEQVRWGMDGPQTDISLTKNFGAEIDLFGSGKNPEGIDYVETTMAQAGQLQVHTLACAIFFHLEPDPMCWTAFGNAWSHPATGVSNPNIPISPDVFTYNDLFNGCIGAGTGGATPTQVFGSAVLEWGWWANYAAWHLVRGYDLRWKIGQHTNIMDEVLRHTAYMPTNGQEGSSSNSEVDVVNQVLRTNQRYDSLASPLNFLKVNRIRIGSVGGAAAYTTNYGIFRPSNDDILVGATYGGMDLRSLLKGNSEFRKLTIPYVIKPGIPIGLVAQVADEDQANTMRSYMALSQQGNTWGSGIITPPVTDDTNIAASYDGSATGSITGNVGLERTIDGNNVPQQVQTARYVFKGGNFKISMGIKGFEVTEDWYTILQNNPDLRSAVMSECSVKFASS
jgi:hypothetical protein